MTTAEIPAAELPATVEDPRADAARAARAAKIT